VCNAHYTITNATSYGCSVNVRSPRLEFQSEKPRFDQRQKIGQLETEIGNLMDAVASGLLRSSPVLAQRLTQTEEELARLKAASSPKAPALLVPDVEAHWLEMIAMLEASLMREDPERARDELCGILGGKIEVTPDESKQFLWADYELGMAALLPNAEIMVAAARLWRCLLRLPR
jgi:hypothetical protein